MGCRRVKPDLKVFTNGPIQIQAMGAGSLNFGTIGPGALWLPASGRSKMIGVNDIGFSDRVIAQASINSIQDLKGKKVGVPRGTSGDMILRMALTKAGMSISDIQVVPMDPSTIVAAFSSKQIEAAGIWYPLIDAIKPRVPDMKELAANKDFYPATSFINAFVARNEIVQENPKLVTSFLSRHEKGDGLPGRQSRPFHRIDDGFPQGTGDTTAKVARSRKLLTSAELDKFTEDGTINKWLTDFNKMFQEFGTVKDRFRRSNITRQSCSPRHKA